MFVGDSLFYQVNQKSVFNKFVRDDRSEMNERKQVTVIHVSRVASKNNVNSDLPSSAMTIGV